jgi:type III pantothenate kinase
MILAIDCGNTRVKWGLQEGGLQEGGLREEGLHEGILREPKQSGSAWRALGALPLADIARLDADWSSLPVPTRIVIANVAGEAARNALLAPLARWRVKPWWASAQAAQCGVTNGYADPGQLGVDRWAALIGAWHLQRGTCLVVNAGTATTVDMLSPQGRFRGGIILPGIDLMQRALAQNTAGLALSQGSFAEEPRCTADAIESGCLHAQAGAIERMYARLEAGAVCLLSGGNAQRILPVLSIPVRAVDNLALEGLVRIGA